MWARVVSGRVAVVPEKIIFQSQNFCRLLPIPFPFNTIFFTWDDFEVNQTSEPPLKSIEAWALIILFEDQKKEETDFSLSRDSSLGKSISGEKIRWGKYLLHSRAEFAFKRVCCRHCRCIYLFSCCRSSVVELELERAQSCRATSCKGHLTSGSGLRRAAYQGLEIFELYLSLVYSTFFRPLLSLSKELTRLDKIWARVVSVIGLIYYELLLKPRPSSRVRYPFQP